MKNDKFSQLVLKKIKNISPRPHWQFLAKDYIIWVLGAFTLIVGALAFAVLLYLARFSDWKIYLEATDSLFKFILLALPYFWIVFLFLFMLLVYYNIKHTRHGYRYSLPVLAVVIVLTSTVLGALFFRVGLGRAIDDILGERAPFYNTIINPRARFWSQPTEGRLAGLAVDMVGEREFKLLDPESQEWTVTVGDSALSDIDILELGQPLRLIGEVLGERLFQADQILPMGPGRRFFKERLERRSGTMRFRQEPSPQSRGGHKGAMIKNLYDIFSVNKTVPITRD